MGVTEIKSKEQFNELVKTGSGVALKATAQWYGPCKAISPVFNKHAEVYAEKPVVFARFDTDHVPELAQQLGLTNIPTFYFFKDRELVTNVRGTNPKALQETVQKVSC
ncbi:thioredoxin domain-containing protein [Penicillium manginii]|uniref:thioredoxin domain-containing protein n=1 Tax=Penicillium manginii TaxID=203109 RepID=UPI00254948C2|nr:thioredoxin domain-containing protein [Penicillium manginii]KAJ5761419.1 thioredoxin domain-containing protein [Penicillium manginii]